MNAKMWMTAAGVATALLMLPMAHAQTASQMPPQAPMGWGSSAWQGWGAPAGASDAIRSQVAEQGFGDVLGIEPKRRHVAVYTTRNGQPIEARFSHDGQYIGWSIPRHVRYAMPGSSIVTDPVSAVTNAGYRDARLIQFKRNHAEVAATTRSGTPVVLHVDRWGRVYSEHRDFGWGAWSPHSGPR